MNICATTRSMLPTISTRDRLRRFSATSSGPRWAADAEKQELLLRQLRGFIQNLHQTSVAFVPDLASRAAAVPSVKPLLNLWPTPSPSDPDFSGIAAVSSSPLQTIREYFGNARFDHNFSAKDNFSAVYTIDDGNDFTPTSFNPYSTDILTLREQVRAWKRRTSFRRPC